MVRQKNQPNWRVLFSAEEGTRTPRLAAPDPKSGADMTVFKFPSTYVFPQGPIHLTDL